MKTGFQALQDAVAHLGNMSIVARAIGKTSQAVSKQMKHGKRVPAEWCIPLETATGGKITRHDLRPDLYPKEDA